MNIYAYTFAGIEEIANENARSEIENAGYRVAHWFADDATTECIPRTTAKQFTAMMNQLSAGDTLVVTKLHHLGCNAEDVLLTIHTLGARQIGIVVLELGSMCLASDTGRCMLKVLNAVIEMDKHRPARPISKTSGRAAKLSRELRARIITEYSQGVRVSKLALRYNVSRTCIQGIVTPKRKDDEPLPLAWGD